MARLTIPGVSVDVLRAKVPQVCSCVEAGATVKEAQHLARHATPNLTMNVYAKTRPARLAEVAEKIGQRALFDPKRAQSVHALAAGAESIDPKSLQHNNLGPNATWWRRRESNPRPGAFQQRRLRV